MRNAIAAIGFLLLAGCMGSYATPGATFGTGVDGAAVDTSGFYTDSTCPSGTYSYGTFRHIAGYHSDWYDHGPYSRGYGSYRRGYDPYYRSYSRPYYVYRTYCRPFMPAGRSELTLLLRGTGQREDNLVRGTGRQYMNGQGTIDFQSIGLATCSGVFTYVSWVIAEGTVTCSDGQSGTLYFTTNGASGRGWVTLTARPFDFEINLI